MTQGEFYADVFFFLLTFFVGVIALTWAFKCKK